MRSWWAASWFCHYPNHHSSYCCCSESSVISLYCKWLIIDWFLLLKWQLSIYSTPSLTFQFTLYCNSFLLSLNFSRSILLYLFLFSSVFISIYFIFRFILPPSPSQFTLSCNSFFLSLNFSIIFPFYFSVSISSSLLYFLFLS